MVDLNEDTLLDTRAASIKLRVSEDTMKAWRVKRKGPPYVKIAGAVRYVQADLEEYLENQTIHPMS